MSHQIYRHPVTGKDSFFSVQQKAWHGLGTIVTDYPNSRDALRFAGLDFSVEKRKLFTLDTRGQWANPDLDCIIPELEVPGYFATVRSDTDQVLGIVGKDYELVQNVDAFDFFDAIVDGEGIQYETAGALGKGERIFITAKLPGYIRVAKEDLIEQYIFLTTSHNGDGSIMAAFTPVRIVCNNTLHAALRNCSNSVKIRHTANAKERLAQAHRLMGICNQFSQQMESILNRWSRLTVSDQHLKQLIERAMVPRTEVWKDLPAQERANLSGYFTKVCGDVFAYAMSSPTQQMNSTRGSLFGAYNAITGYFQNVKSYKSSEAKLKSLFYGGIAQIRSEKAFGLCTAFEKDGPTVLN